MEVPILLILFSAYLSSILSKLFLIHIEEKNLRSNIDFVLVPFYYYFNKKKNAGLEFKLATIGISELSSIFFGIVLTLGLHIQFGVAGVSLEEKIILSVVYIFVFVTLLYLSVFDIIHLAIPENFLKGILLVIVITNLLFGAYKLIIFRSEGIEPFPSVYLGTFGSILAGVILGGIIFLINRLSNKKAIGEGDIFIMMIIGFTLGFPLGLISFFLTCILGSIVGIVYSLIVRKFKGVLVPFVPLILLGFVFTLAIGSQLINLLTLNF